MVAGLVVARRADDRWLAAALAATGIGSFLFHGPMPPGSQWAHDVSIAWLLVVAAATTTRWESQLAVPSAVVLGLTFALAPGVAVPTTVVIAILAIPFIAWRDRRPRTFAALGLLVVGAVVARLSATGGPWCHPDSPLQGHAAWHVLAATAIAWWALTRDAG